MNIKNAEKLIINAYKKSANSSATIEELIAEEFANSQSKPKVHVDTPEDKKLKELCYDLPVKRYGLFIPGEAVNRLEDEIEIITENGHSHAYILAYEVANKCRELVAPYMTLGAAGSSYVAFILGITHTNPLPFHLYCSACGYADTDVDKYYDGGYDGDDGEDDLDHCGFDIVKTTCPICGDEFEGDGHDIPFEIFAGLKGEKAPRFQIDVPEELYDEINGFLQSLLTEEELKKPESERCVRVSGNPLMSLFYKLQDETLVSEDCISIDGVDFRKYFSKGDYKVIPLLEKIPDEIITKVYPFWFSDIVKLLGLLHGTSNLGEVEEYLLDDEDDLCINNVICHKENVMQTLMNMGMVTERAYHITEAIGDDCKTSVSDDDLAEMREKGIPDEFIFDLTRISYLFPKAHDTEFAIKLYKLMWYHQNFPEEYNRAIKEYRDAIKSKKEDKYYDFNSFDYRE